MHSVRTYMATSVFNCTVTVYITQLSQTATIGIVWRICEAVHNHRIVIAVEHFTYATIQFIVCNWSPKRRLLITNLSYVTHGSVEHLCTIIGIIWASIFRRTVGRRRSLSHTAVWRVGIGIYRAWTTNGCHRRAVRAKVIIKAGRRIAYIMGHCRLAHLVEL